MSGQVVDLEVDRSRCPLCGEPNACVIERRAKGEQVDDPCWCVARVFPADVLERATARDEGRSCVCESCLERASEPAAR